MAAFRSSKIIRDIMIVAAMDRSISVPDIAFALGTTDATVKRVYGEHMACPDVIPGRYRVSAPRNPVKRTKAEVDAAWVERRNQRRAENKLRHADEQAARLEARRAAILAGNT